eukprot:7365804-Prymnesium_polylepis.1
MVGRPREEADAPDMKNLASRLMSRPTVVLAKPLGSLGSGGCRIARLTMCNSNVRITSFALRDREEGPRGDVERDKKAHAVYWKPRWARETEKVRHVATCASPSGRAWLGGLLERRGRRLLCHFQLVEEQLGRVSDRLMDQRANREID